MGVREAVLKVLQETGHPLHVKTITERILDKGLWQSNGKTPHATVAARLYADIKKNGDDSPFVQTAPQTFGVRPDATISAPKQKAAERARVKKATTQEYSFTEAAEKVLEQFGHKEPMHYRDITKKALDMRWIGTEGRTPEATMAAQLYTTIKRAQRRGEQPRLVQHGRGVFGLSKWMGQGLAYPIAQHNKQVRQALRKRLLGLKSKEFEDLVALLLVEMGFEDTDVVGRTGDGGIDVRAMLVVGDVIRIHMAIQAKKWKPGSNVQAPDVQRVRGSLGTHDQGLINYLNDNRLRKLPEEIIRSKDEIYSEQDPLIQFIEEECEFDEKFWTSGMALRKAYADWIALKKPMSDISFYKQLLTGRPMIQKKKGRVNNHVVGGFNGIRLIDEPFQTDIGF